MRTAPKCESLKEVYINCMWKLYGTKYRVFSMKFFLGPLLRKILEDSKDKVTRRSTHQLYAYAGHDSTVANLLIALGVWDQQIPTYDMLALIELHETAGEQFYFKVSIFTDFVFFFYSRTIWFTIFLFIQVYLRNESSTEPYRLQIPNCKDDSCTLEHVSKLTANVRPSDLAKECMTDNSRFSSKNIVDRGPWWKKKKKTLPIKLINNT